MRAFIKNKNVASPDDSDQQKPFRLKCERNLYGTILEEECFPVLHSTVAICFVCLGACPAHLEVPVTVCCAGQQHRPKFWTNESGREESPSFPSWLFSSQS